MLFIIFSHTDQQTKNLQTSFHFNRLLRAHFLAAEAADALLVVVDGWMVFAISEVYSFAGDGTAVDADAAADAFVWLDVGLLLENVQRFGQFGPDVAADFGAVYVEAGIAVFFY